MSAPDFHPHRVDDAVDSSVDDRPLPAPTDQVVRPLRATAATPRRQQPMRESAAWILAPAAAGIVTGLIMNLAGANALYIAAAMFLVAVLVHLTWSKFRYLRRIRRAKK